MNRGGNQEPILAVRECPAMPASASKPGHADKGVGMSRLATLPEVAADMAVSVRELRRLRAVGRFGPDVISLGKRLQRVRRRELADWINAGCPPAARWMWESRKSEKRS